MIIRAVQSKDRKDRHVMLPPEILGLLRQWWKERPAKRASCGSGYTAVTLHDLTDSKQIELSIFGQCLSFPTHKC